MVRTPTESDKELIIETMNEVNSPLVYAPSLYGELELHHEMDHDVLQAAMRALKSEDRVRWLCVSPDNEDDIPASEYVYEPDLEQEIHDFLE